MIGGVVTVGMASDPLMFLAVVVALILKLGYDVWVENVRPWVDGTS